MLLVAGVPDGLLNPISSPMTPVNSKPLTE
jgi:hypothetical protein